MISCVKNTIQLLINLPTKLLFKRYILFLFLVLAAEISFFNIWP